MKRLIITCLFILSTGLWSTIFSQQQPSNSDRNLFDGQFAPLLEGMGDLHFKISTDDTLVQGYFNQGLILAYGFNHKEAERSFRQAAELAPNHPMPQWGIALVQGPNLNLPMLPESIPVAWESLQKAIELKENGTQKEQDYIEALSFRYEENPPDDRTFLDSTYAEAMGRLSEKYPDDLDAKVLYAEALMDLHPWDFWKKDGTAQPWTPRILKILDSVIKIDPDHPGANHFYIHATEASRTPELALESANRLRYAVPGAGHLVHMPSHTYIRVGKYHEGTLANQRAIQADNDYIAQCNAQGVYPLAYIPHNHHFLWATATLEGRKKLSIEAAENTAALTNDELLSEPGFKFLQHYKIIPLYVYVRFGEWKKIMHYPEPQTDLLYPRGILHYARGMAFLGMDDIQSAEKEYERLNEINQKEEVKSMESYGEILRIARHVLKGEIAAANEEYDTAIENLKLAVEAEDQLPYKEPPDWFYPVRHNLGAVLLESGKPKQAEKIYREDLKQFPENGWALFGLQQSLEAQSKNRKAKKFKSEFENAWRYADVEIESSIIW